MLLDFCKLRRSIRLFYVVRGYHARNHKPNDHLHSVPTHSQTHRTHTHTRTRTHGCTNAPQTLSKSINNSYFESNNKTATKQRKKKKIREK